MDICPCCNARLKQLTICYRCQADLNRVISAEQMAKIWFVKALEYWLDNKTEKCCNALIFSLHLKKTRIAIIFRDFIIQKQCENIMALLSKKQILPAKKSLYRMRCLHSYSLKLQQLSLFSDYLLTRVI